LIEARSESLACKVLEAVCVQIEQEKHKPDGARDFSVTTITKLANLLADYENMGGDAPKVARARLEGTTSAMSPRGVGGILKADLRLRTEQVGQGKQRRRHVMYEPGRIEALRRRYGVSNDDLVSLLEIVNEVGAAEEDIRQEQTGQIPLPST
jgi:hypothetical protein